MTQRSPDPIPLATPIPANEAERLAALHRYQILDTPPEPAFDRITSLAARLFNAPIALVSLLDESRAWFKSGYGFEPREVERNDTICSFAVLSDDVLVALDTRQDPRFSCNPFVQSDPGVRCYIGAPLITHDGFNLGTLCLLDTQPREAFSLEQQAMLTDLAAMVVDELELRLAAQRIAQTDAAMLEITQGVSGAIGEAFLNALVQHFAKVLSVDYTYIGLLVDRDQESLKTIATCAHGQIVENFEYLLRDTPCKEVIRQRKLCCYPQNVQALFPHAPLLTPLQVESYIAVPFYDSSGAPLGLLGVMDSKPLENIQLAEFLLPVFALRIATELERQQTEAALQKSEEQSRNILESIDDGFFALDENWRFTYVNQAAERLTRRTAAELLDKNFWEEFPGVAGTEFEQLHHRTMYDRVAGSVTAFYPDHDRWYAVHAYPAAQGITVYFRDVTAQLQSEESLRRSEERFQAFMNHSPAAYWITDRDGRILYLNQTYFDLFQFETQDVIGKTVHDIYSTDIAQQFLDNIQQAADTHQAVKTTEVAPRSDGTMGEFLVYKFPITHEPETVLVGGVAIDITDRKQTEVALSESEARFRTLTTTVPQLIWTATPDGSVDYLSDQWADYIGLPPKQLYDWNWQQVVHPDDLPNTLRDWAHSIQSGTPLEIQHRFRYHTEEWRWQLVRGIPIQDETGQVTKWVGTCTDIHESEMREQDARFLSDLSEVIRTIENADQLMIKANEMLGQYLKLKRCYFAQTDEANDHAWIASDYHHDSLPSLVGEHRLSRYQPVVLELLRSGHLYISNDNKLDPRSVDCYETVYEPLAIRAHVAVPFHTNGHWAVNLIAATDEPRQWQEREINLLETVAERVWLAVEKRRSEAALRQSEERYRLLAQAIPQFVWVTDAAGQNEYVNQRFCDYTGLAAEQLRGSNWLSILHPDDLAMTCNRWLTAVTSGRVYEIEYRFRRADGSYRWFLGQGIPLKDEQGQIYKWFGTCTDIEPQKQIEQARLRLLEQEQAAREQAESANRIKDEFLAVLSHELRSPLNPILGWISLLQKGKLNATRQQEALAIIERNAKLQAQLVEDLLDISRIMRGKLSLTITPVNLESVISAALETVRLAAEAKQLQIRSDLDSGVAPISGDAARLQQVVWNLLTNAVKFTPNGGQVTVELRQLDHLAQIRVIDTGKGINPQFLPHVFEYFRQEDGSTTRKFGGLGLGLAIVRQIVELHGGTVWAESRGENQGATFIVQLPLLRNRESGAGSRESKVESPLPTPHFPLTGLQILLVDDEPDTREFQAFLLEQSGAKVTAVASGLEALQSLDQFIPDAIVSDIGMADMDGYMLMQQIRSRPPSQGGQVPAIALTAYARDLDQQKARQVGFHAHITKPVEPEALVEAIASLLR